MPSPAELLAKARASLAGRAVPQGLRAFHQAEKTGADPNACDAGRWECAMLLGRWDEAWAASDRIAARGGDTGRFWDGTPLAGKRVMLRCLHGYGDALQMIRFAPLLRAQARSLCVEAAPELVPLLRVCAGVDEVITWSPPPNPAPEWDTQVEIMELPWILRAAPETLPAPPYLDPGKLIPDTNTEAWVERIEARRGKGRLQLGISWRCSDWNPFRSVPFPVFAQALPEGCDVYSLQQGGAPDLVGTAIENSEADFPNLARRMAALDAVLTIDSVLAHLAGALGLPVVVLLPFAADWRWGLEAATPWYPRARLFRRQQPGDWSSLGAEAAAHLNQLR